MSQLTDKLEYLSATELGEAVNKGQLSPTEVVKYFIKRIEEKNKDINAFVYVKEKEALKRAKEIEQNLVEVKKSGDLSYLGPFTGVPFGLKDFLPAGKKGWQHSYGGVKCMIQEDSCDSMFCEAMENAGGIPIGKTNAPAFGFRGTTDNKLYGPTHNPFDLRYNSGGSSGGSAAAVAAGIVPIAEGGDAGGSIRIPAAWCNCVGYKAALGTIPSVCRPDAWAATHPFCFNGGITKTVEDTANLLMYMGKYNPRDPYSVCRDLNLNKAVNLGKKVDLKYFKIAYTPDFGIFPVDNQVRDAVEKTLKKFEEAGAEITEIDVKMNRTLNELAEIWCRGISVDTAIELELLKKEGIDYIKDHKEDFPEEFIYWKDKALESNIFDYYNFNLARTEMIDLFENILDNYDLLISPTCACLPVLNGDDGNTKGPASLENHNMDQLIGFAETFLTNLSGHPSMSIPAGFSKEGLPIGMQIIGRKVREDIIFTAASAFEILQPWRDKYLF